MAVGDTYELTWQTQLEQRIFYNVFHYEQTIGSDVPETAEVLCRTFSAAMLAAWISATGTTFHFQCVTARRVLPGPDVPGVLFQPPDTKGTQPGDPLPSHNTIVVKLLTDNPNPKHNGRLYINGQVELSLLNGMWEATYLATVFNGLHSLFTTTLVAAGPDDQEFEPRVLNKFAGGVPIVPPTTSNVIGTSASPLVFRQKRRATRQTQVAEPVL